MYKLSDIINKKVIDINTASYVGVVVDIIAEHGVLTHILTCDKMIAVTDIVGIASYITIMSLGTSYHNHPVSLTTIGGTALTNKGIALGTIDDYLLTPTFRISKIVISEKFYSTMSIASYSHDYIIMSNRGRTKKMLSHSVTADIEALNGSNFTPFATERSSLSDTTDTSITMSHADNLAQFAQNTMNRATDSSSTVSPVGNTYPHSLDYSSCTTIDKETTMSPVGNTYPHSLDYSSCATIDKETTLSPVVNTSPTCPQHNSNEYTASLGICATVAGTCVIADRLSESREMLSIEPPPLSDYSFLVGRIITRDIYEKTKRIFCSQSTISIADVTLARGLNKLVDLTLYSRKNEN